MLEAEKLRVALSGRPVLHDVDLRLRAGALTVIAGPNGAGKSTLLKALTGLLPPGAGRVTLDGTPLGDWPRQRLARRRAVLAQSQGFAFPFTVFEMVALGARAGGSGGAPRGLVARCLEAVDLLAHGGRLVGELSGGEQQRVHIARVLCQLGGPGAAVGPEGPRWLFLDEPTAALDIAHQLAVLDLAREHARAGGGAVAILHDLNLAGLYADRLVVLAGGGIVGEGRPDEVLTPALLRSTFGGRFASVRVAGATYVVPAPGGGAG